jgi:hypothetical protein
MASIQALTTKEMTSKAHMQVHTNEETREKLRDKSSGPTGPTQPIPGPVRHPFDLSVIQTIYSSLVKSQGGIHSWSAAEEQRREGHHSREERVEMVD